MQYSLDLAKALEKAKERKYTGYLTGGHRIVGKLFEEADMHEWLFAKGVRN